MIRIRIRKKSGSAVVKTVRPVSDRPDRSACFSTYRPQSVMATASDSPFLSPPALAKSADRPAVPSLSLPSQSTAASFSSPVLFSAPTTPAPPPSRSESAGSPIMELILLEPDALLAMMYPWAASVAKPEPPDRSRSLSPSSLVLSDMCEHFTHAFVQQVVNSAALRDELEQLTAQLRVGMRAVLEAGSSRDANSRAALLFSTIVMTIDRYANAASPRRRSPIEQELVSLLRYGNEITAEPTFPPAMVRELDDGRVTFATSRRLLVDITVASFEQLARNPAFLAWRSSLTTKQHTVYPPAREAHFRHCFFRPLPPFALPPAAMPFDREWQHNHARWCAHLACLVYMDDADIRAIAKRVYGLSFHTFIENTETATQACVFGNDCVTVVAFRGSEKAEDWRTNQDYKLVPLFDGADVQQREVVEVVTLTDSALSSGASSPALRHQASSPSPIVDDSLRVSSLSSSSSSSPCGFLQFSSTTALRPPPMSLVDGESPPSSLSPPMERHNSQARRKSRRRSQISNTVLFIDDAAAASNEQQQSVSSDELLVHRGFKSAYFSIAQQVEALVLQRRDRASNRPPPLLYLTGHSLGGALSTVCLASFLLRDSPIDVHGVYTFGQPRVGNVAFERVLQAQSACQIFRCVNSTDIVPKLPPGAFGFKHAGQPVLITAQKQLNPTPSKEQFKSEHAHVAGQIVNHTKNEYLACMELISAQEASAWSPPQAKAAITLHRLRYVDALQLPPFVVVFRFGAYVWTTPPPSSSQEQASPYSFEIPQLYESDELTIELADSKSLSRVLASAVIGFDSFDCLTDVRVPLSPAAGYEDAVQSTACVCMDVTFATLPDQDSNDDGDDAADDAAGDDLNADWRQLKLTVHELCGVPASSTSSEATYIAIVRHRGCEWASLAHTQLRWDFAVRVPRCQLGDSVEVEVQAVQGGRTVVYGRACFDIAPRFVDVQCCQWTLTPPLDPDPSVVYNIQGDVVLSLAFVELPRLPRRGRQRVATATVTVQEPLRLPNRSSSSSSSSGEREFIIRSYHGGQSWSSPVMKLAPVKPWNYSFVVAKMTTAAPLEFELIELSSGGRQDYVGRALFHQPSLVGDVDVDLPLVLGRRVNTACDGVGGLLAEAASIGSYAASTAFRGSLRVSIEFKPCADVVRRKGQLATGQTRICRVDVQLPRFMRELGVPLMVSVPVQPDSTVASAVAFMLKKLVMPTLAQHDQEAVKRTLAFFQLGIVADDSDAGVRLLAHDVNLWQVRPTARLVFRSTEFMQDGAGLPEQRQVALRVHMPLWQSLLGVASTSLLVGENDTVLQVIDKLFDKLAKRIASPAERELALRQGKSFALFARASDSDGQLVELADHTKIAELASNELTFTISARSGWKHGGTSDRKRGVRLLPVREHHRRPATVALTVTTPSPSPSPSPPRAEKKAEPAVDVSCVLSHRTWQLQSLDGKLSDFPRCFVHSSGGCALATLGGRVLPLPFWKSYRAPELPGRLALFDCFAHAGRTLLACVGEDGQFVVADATPLCNPALCAEPLSWDADAVAGWLAMHDDLAPLADSCRRLRLGGGALISSSVDELAEQLHCHEAERRAALASAYDSLVVGLGSGQRNLTVGDATPLAAVLRVAENRPLEAMRGAYARSLVVVVSADRAAPPQLWIGTVLAGRDFADESGQLLIVDAESGASLATIYLPHAASAMCLAGERVWVGGAGRLSIVDVAGARQVSRPLLLSGIEDVCAALCAVDGEVWCGSSAGLSVFDAGAGALLDQPPDTPQVSQIRCVSPQLVVTASLAGGIVVWDVASRRQLACLSLPRDHGLPKAIGCTAVPRQPGVHQLWCASTGLVVTMWTLTVQARLDSSPASSSPPSEQEDRPPGEVSREQKLRQRLEHLRSKRASLALRPELSF